MPPVNPLAAEWPLRHPHGMAAARSFRAFALRCAPVAALAMFGYQAHGQDGRPFAPLADAVVVRTYPVPTGPDTIPPRRTRALIDRLVDETIAARGEPLARETWLGRNAVHLAYPDTLIVVTNDYSGNLVCRVEIRPRRLREAVAVDLAVALAGESCRNAEVRGWGAAGHRPALPIGSEALPGVAGATMEIYATDDLLDLFPVLVRAVTLERNSEAVLVRRQARDEAPPRDDTPEWRYAWFADGHFLAVRYQAELDRMGRRTVGLACVAKGAAAQLPPLDVGAFANWCDRHSDRLRPGLAGFVDSVRAYSRSLQEREAPTQPLTAMIAVPGGFHTEPVPPGLAEHFWRAGAVTSDAASRPPAD